MLRVEQHKGFGNDLQPSSSFQVSGRQQSNDYDKVNSNLEEFVKYFVKEFEAKLHAYHMILEGEVKKSGKFSDTFSGKIGQGVGGAAGGLVGLLLGSPVSGAKLGAKAGEEGGKKLGSKIGDEHHRKKVISLSELVYYSKKNKANVRRMLVEAGFDVFQSFEMQFMRVTTDQGHEGAMRKLAEDATNRAISYYMQKEDALITEGVVLGESKIEQVLGVPIATSKIKTPGFKVNYKYKSSEKEWVTASLYKKAGLVLEKKSPSYYEKKDGKSRTDKYGYRRLFTSEDWNKLENECRLSDVVRSVQFTDYQYISNLENLKSKVTNILAKINSDDKDLTEERVRKVLEEVKDDIIKEINTLKKQSDGYTEDRKILVNIEANLKDLKVDEYLKKFKQYFEEAKQERQKIAKSIEASREESRENFNQLSQKQDIHHDDNKRGHKKTQEGIDELKVEQGELQDKIEKLSKKIAGASNKQVKDKEPVWFGVENPIESFTGRGEQLGKLHIALQSRGETVISQTVSVSGLGGVGKSELARKYAHDHGNDYDGNVVWINAESYQTLAESFCKLAQDKLGISTKNSDGMEKDVKSIVEDVYRFFSKKKSLFIFDNAKKCRTREDGDEGIGKFLPSLPSNVNKPCVLITSRNQEWGDIQSLTLGTFTESESIDFIRKALGVKNESQETEIRNLAETLQHFPLALQQAVAYIKERDKALKNVGSKFEISDYLKRYDEETKKLLNFKFPDGSRDLYTKTTFTTWRITTDKIKKNNEYGEQAGEILDIIAYFAPDNIHVQMFLGLELIGDDEEKLGDAVKLLKQYSMINSGQKQTLNVHRLVQQVMRIGLAEQKKEEKVLKKALELINNDNISEESTSHARSIWSYASKYNKLIDDFCFHDNSIYGYNRATPLHLLAESGNLEAVRNILACKGEGLSKIILDTARDHYGRTVLNYAAKSGNLDFVKYLIKEKGADVTCDDWDVIRFLLEHGVYFEITGRQYNLNFLRSAVDCNAWDVVRLLLEQDVHFRDNNKENSIILHKAVSTISPRSFSVVKFLVEKDINFKISGEDGLTPLEKAAKCNRWDIVEFLLEKDVHFKADDKENLVILHEAINGRFYDRLKIVNVVKVLIEKGVDFKSADKDGWTPLEKAVYYGKSDIVKILIEKGADIFEKNDRNVALKNHHSILHKASHSDNDKVIRLVLDEIKDQKKLSEYVNVQDSDGDTPLLWAAKFGKVSAVQILLEHGAEVNVRGDGGKTALHCAVKFREVKIVQLLLSKQANPNIQDDKEKTPLDLVQEELQEELDKNQKIKDLEKIKNLLSDAANQLSNQSKVLKDNENNVLKMDNIKESQSLGLSGPGTRLDDVLIVGNARELVAGRR